MIRPGKITIIILLCCITVAPVGSSSKDLIDAAAKALGRTRDTLVLDPGWKSTFKSGGHDLNIFSEVMEKPLEAPKKIRKASVRPSSHFL